MDKGKLDHIVSEYIKYLEEKSKIEDCEINWELSMARHEEHTNFLVEQMNLSNDPEDKQYYRDSLLFQEKILEGMQAYKKELDKKETH
jgi:hypothetical protein